MGGRGGDKSQIVRNIFWSRTPSIHNVFWIFFLAVVKFNFLTRKFYSRRRRFQIVKMEISNFSANINLVVVVEKVIKIILLRMPSGNHNMLIKRCEPMDIFIVAIDFNSFF